jgi:hypothetical protein
MTRFTSCIISVIAMFATAIAVAPAAAQPAPSSGDYQSQNALVAAGPGSTSLNAALTSSSSGPGSTSVNAALGGGSSSSTAPISGAHEPEPTIVAVPSVAADTGNDSGGFDWTLALIVAGAACALVALGLAGARTATRHRRAAAA